MMKDLFVNNIKLLGIFINLMGPKWEKNDRTWLRAIYKL